MYVYVHLLLLFQHGGQSTGASCANKKARKHTAHVNLHTALLRPNSLTSFNSLTLLNSVKTIGELEYKRLNFATVKEFSPFPNCFHAL